MTTSSFDSASKDLVTLCRKILTFDNPFATKKEKKKNPKNLLLKALDNYYQDYSLSEEKDNKDDVLATYRKIRVPLLKGWRLDEWLKTSNINVYSGATEPDEKRKIMLSAIYLQACRQRDQAKESLEGLPVEAYDGKEELLYPSYFQLYMYRLFLFALDGEEHTEDITKLNTSVTELEKELKITSTAMIATTEGAPETLVGLDGFFGLAKDLIGKMGVQVPDNAQLPSDPTNLIMQAATSMFSQPETQTLLADIGESLKGAKDLEEVLSTVVTKFKGPTGDIIKKVALGTLETQGIYKPSPQE